MDSLEKLTELSSLIDSLEPLIDSCLEISNDDLIASRNIHLAFALNTLYLLEIRLSGQSLKDHPIKREILRIKEYFKKLDKCKSLYLTIANMKIDKDAAKRFIERSLKI